MASVSRGMGVPSDQPQGAYYTVTITQTIYSAATGGNLGGGVSPKMARDHGTAPTTLVISRMLNRGNIRYKKMLEFLQTRTNVKILNLYLDILLTFFCIQMWREFPHKLL